MWASKASKMGYRWKIGNGKKGEVLGRWFGSYSLAI
jgi:hypothetical protein